MLMTTTFASILKDPYIQKELKNLKKTFRSFSNKNAASVATIDEEVQTSEFNGIKISSSEALDAVVGNLLASSSNLDDTPDMEELSSYEELVSQLPSISWKNSLNKALTKDLKKSKLVNKLDELRNGTKKDEIDSIHDLKRFSKDVQRVTTDLENILSDEEMEPVTEAKQYLGKLVNEKMTSLYTENPLNQCLQLCEEMDNKELAPEDLLSHVYSLKAYLEAAKVQVTIPIEKSERKALRLNYLEAEKTYKQAIEDLLHYLPKVNADDQEKILSLLDVNEFDQLENKDAFISALDTNLFVDVKEKDARKLVQKQLGVFLFTKANSPAELKKALLMMEILPFKKLHGDHQDMVAETLFTDDEELLESLDEDLLGEKITEYSNHIEEVLQSFNGSTSIKKMKAILNENLQEAWTQFDKDKQEQIARQLLFKKEIRPYRSLKKIENDFKKAAKQRLVTGAEIENHPYIYSSNQDDVVYLTNQASEGIKTLIKADSYNKTNDFADTFTLIG
ncbi:hypothetical protein EU245_14825 [Lentibacillus lipolyticus]|nr:hypothetical protein EU245_14825 [Lentibacillus lipolyticus]